MVELSVSSLYANAKAILKQAGIENFRNEAILLVCSVLGFEKYQLSTMGDTIISEEYIDKLEKLLERRINGEPLQYLLGEWEFFGLDFKVGEGVLIPRADTETLVEVALNYAKEQSNLTIIDLCSGSGCVAISLEKNIKNTEVFAVELSDKAIFYLQKNIVGNNSNVKFIKGDVLEISTTEKFPQVDMIVSNPPYLTADDMENLQKEVEFEPSMALEAGEDGLEFYENISKVWHSKLKQNGIIAFECGINQHQSIKEILQKNGYTDICFTEDLCGIIRVISARKK